MRVSTCNLHGKSTKAGVTVVIPQFSVKQFVLSTPPSHDYSRYAAESLSIRENNHVPFVRKVVFSLTLVSVSEVFISYRVAVWWTSGWRRAGWGSDL